MAVVQKGNRWYVVTKYRTRAGDRKQKWVGSWPTREEALAAVPMVRANLDGGTLAGYVRAWAERRFAAEALRPTTYQQYVYVADVLAKTPAGGLALQDVTASDLEALYTELRGRLSRGTVATVHRTVRAALNDAVKRGDLASTPTHGVEAPKMSEPKMTTWSPARVRSFLDFARREDPRWYALWATAALTGMRRGEVLGLQWSDLDLDVGLAHVRRAVLQVASQATVGQPKTRNGHRAVALPPQAVEALREHQERHGGGGDAWVFADRDGRLVRPDSTTRRFQRLARRAGLPVIRFHDLRHSFCTNAAEAGVRPEVLQKMVGHANVYVTLGYYVHVRDEWVTQAALRVAEAVFPAPDASPR